MKPYIPLLLLMLLLVTGCSNETNLPSPTPTPSPIEATQETESPSPSPSPTATPTPQPTPAPPAELTQEQQRSIVENALTALKANDVQKVNEYLSYEMLTGYDEAAQAVDTQQHALATALFQNLSWQIQAIGLADDGLPVVTVSITAVDMEVAIAQFTVDSLQMTNENDSKPAEEQYGDEQLQAELVRMFIDIVKNTADTVSTVVPVKLAQEDELWKIQIDDTLRNALTGNMLKATNIADE